MQTCSASCISSESKLLIFVLWYCFALSLGGSVLLVRITQTYVAVLCALDAEVLNVEGSHKLAAFLGAFAYWLGLGLTSYIIYRRRQQSQSGYEGYIPIEQEMAERN